VRPAPGALALDFAPRELEFGPEDYRRPQTVLVTTPNNDRADGPRQGEITFYVDAPDDPAFAKERPGALTTTLIDDDTASITSLGALALREGDPTGTIHSFALGAGIVAPVTLRLRLPPGFRGTISPAEVTFTPDKAKEVASVKVVVDRDGEIAGRRSSNFQGEIVTTDPGYAALGTQAIPVSIEEHDFPGIDLGSDSSLRLAESASARRVSLPIALGARPRGRVTVSITPTDPTEVAVEPRSLVFGTQD
jgi:hypothetical protein